VPFLYKLGDTLASYIETNTDEFNNLRPFEFEDSSEEEEAESEVGDLVGNVDESNLDPREEEKDQPIVEEIIKTTQTNAIQSEEKEEKDEPIDLEQEA
jgi:hypothetical protein